MTGPIRLTAVDAPPRFGGRVETVPTGFTRIERGVAMTAFAALLLATIALNAFRIGTFPIRGFATIGVLALTVLFFFDVTVAILRKHALLLWLAAGLALLGTFVSVVNGAPAADILRNLAEVHMQAAATIMAAAILAHIAGARASALLIVAVVGASACVAVAQMMDVQAAWTLRRALGPLAAEEFAGLNFAERRPTGLAYSPIQLSTHLCLAFAAFLAVRHRMRSAAIGADPLVLPALLALFAASIAAATRSPILGGIVFVAAYSLQQRTTWLLLFLVLASIFAYVAWPLLMGVVESSAPRVVRTDDNSANARATLVYYGLRLFADNPLGYGFTFAPMTLWHSYWHELYTMAAPRGVRENDLHNYAVNMMNIYGIGLLLLTPLVARLLWHSRASLIFFIPYVVHISFHNSGPFYNDNVLWFAVAAIASARQATVDAPESRRSSRPRRPAMALRMARLATRPAPVARP